MNTRRNCMQCGGAMPKRGKGRGRTIFCSDKCQRDLAAWKARRHVKEERVLDIAWNARTLVYADIDGREIVVGFSKRELSTGWVASSEELRDMLSGARTASSAFLENKYVGE